jgi:hypothetical protein
MATPNPNNVGPWLHEALYCFRRASREVDRRPQWEYERRGWWYLMRHVGMVVYGRP